MTIDEEMKLWEERANDEFGTLLKKIQKLASPYLYTWWENGIKYSPISEYITMYALDGNRKFTATHIKNILYDYDILGNHCNIKKLVDQLFTLF